MLYLYLGTDRKKAREAMHTAIAKIGKDRDRATITDAHTIADLEASFAGGGMFAQSRLVVFDGTFVNPEMREKILAELARLKASEDLFFVLEEKVDAATKRAIGKYAEKVETFDAAKSAPDNTIFKLRFALEKGDKKTLWVGLMHEYAAGKPAEATHGFLFWAAKQMALTARGQAQLARAHRLLIALAELPHESRRAGCELEYALERFVLSQT